MTRAAVVTKLMEARLADADELLDVVAPRPEEDVAPPFVAVELEGPRAPAPRPKRRRSVQRSREVIVRVRPGLLGGWR